MIALFGLVGTKFIAIIVLFNFFLFADARVPSSKSDYGFNGLDKHISEK